MMVAEYGGKTRTQPSLLQAGKVLIFGEIFFGCAKEFSSVGDSADSSVQMPLEYFSEDPAKLTFKLAS